MSKQPMTQINLDDHQGTIANQVRGYLHEYGYEMGSVDKDISTATIRFSVRCRECHERVLVTLNPEVFMDMDAVGVDKLAEYLASSADSTTDHANNCNRALVVAAEQAVQSRQGDKQNG